MSPPLFRLHFGYHVAVDDGWLLVLQLGPRRDLMSRPEAGRLILVGLELRAHLRSPLEPAWFHRRRVRWPLRLGWRSDAEEIAWRLAERAGWARCGPMAGREPEEGDFCPVCPSGLLECRRVDPCTCHMGHPPCSSCTDAPVICDECSWRHDLNG